MNEVIAANAWAFLDQAHETVPWDAIHRLADHAAESYDARRRLLEIVFPEDGDPDDSPITAPWVLAGAVLLLTGPRLSDTDRRELARQVLTLFRDMDEHADFDYEFVSRCVGSLGPVVLPDVLAALDEEEQIDAEGHVAVRLWSLLELVAQTDDPALREPAIERCMTALRDVVEDTDGQDHDADCYFNAAWTLARIGHDPARPLLAALAQRRYPGPLGRSTAAEYGHALACLEGRDDAGKYPPSWTEPLLPGVERWWTIANDPENEVIDDWDDDCIDLDAADILPYLSPLLDDVAEHEIAPDWPMPYRREAPKIGRNDPCPCGSGKKYKKCCGSKA